MALARPRLVRAYFSALMFMLALLLCISVGIGGIAVYASDGGESPPTTPPVTPITPIVEAVPIVPISEEIIAVSSASSSMIVNASWLDDEMLRIDVVDITTGAVSSLAVRLSDFVTSEDAQNNRYLKIQAVDLYGNLSGIVQISNPFYNPAPPAVIADGGQGGISGGHIGGGVSDAGSADGVGGNDGDSTDDSISAVPNPGGLTPDGTGTVVDNVVTQNEIEFFTVFTEEGNVFFLVVDRNRNSDNVYLLNAVTEADLMALAEQRGNPIAGGNDTDVSAVPMPPNLQPPAGGADGDGQAPTTTQPDSGDGSDSDEGGADAPAQGGNNNLIFIAIILVVVGGVAYYFKIVKPKKSNAATDDDLWGDDAEDNWDGEDDYLNSEESNEDTSGGGDDE